VSVRNRKCSPMERVGSMAGRIKEKVSFEFKVEKVRVMDNDSDDDGTNELRLFG